MTLKANRIQDTEIASELEIICDDKMTLTIKILSLVQSTWNYLRLCSTQGKNLLKSCFSTLSTMKYFKFWENENLSILWLSVWPGLEEKARHSMATWLSGQNSRTRQSVLPIGFFVTCTMILITCIITNYVLKFLQVLFFCQFLSTSG